MSNPIEVLRDEGGVIAAAPWSFAICLFVVGGVIYLILRAMKAQEIADLNSRLTLRNDEIADYRRKLDGKSPDEAKAFVEALEVEAAVEAEADAAPSPPPSPKPAPRRAPRAQPAPEAPGARSFVSAEEYEAALAKTAQMTSIQSAKELEGLVGKWRTLTGPLYDVRASSKDQLIVFVQSEGSVLGCRFNGEWADRLSLLRTGEDITLIGRIAGFSSGVRLDHCELVETGP